MVLYKNKHFVTRSDAPDTDFMGDADFVVPDDSELAEKIIRLYPNFEFVFDDDGNISDVVETEPEPKPPEITTEQRLTAMENAVEEIINILMEV